MSFATGTSASQPVHQPPTSAQPDTALGENELRLLEQTFKRLPDVIRIYDIAAQQTIYRNRSFAAVLGYPGDSAADDTLLHPDDSKRVHTQLIRTCALDDNGSAEIAYRLKRADGNWQWFTEQQVVFKRHNDGTAAQILRTARCCSELHLNTDHYPPARAELLEHVVEYSLPNFALLLFDHNLRYQLAIGLLLKQLGFLTDQLEGHMLTEVVPPSIIDWLEPAYHKALAGQEIQLEHEINSLIVGIHCLPVRDEQGHVIAGMALIEDITDDRQATAALIESEQRFAQFSENIEAIFWMLDTSQKQLLYISPVFAQIWESDPEAAFQNPSSLLDTIHPEDRDRVVTVLRDTFVHGSHDIKFRLQLPSGKLRWLSSRAFPIYDEAGSIYRVAGIANDITRQVEIEKDTFDLALERERMQLLSQFISTTSHELRTPLTIINTSLYLMKKTNDPDKHADRLRIIEHQVAQLARLVGQMHMLLRIENATPNYPMVSINLNHMLSRLEADYKDIIAKKELNLSFILADNLPVFYAHADWVVIALQNVFDNAINYTDSGSVTVRSSVEDQTVVLTVTDTGIGISTDDLPHIFERFYKVEENKRRDGVSAGLGLAITRRIMELTRGTIDVESHPGQGSTFRLSWPASTPTT